MPNLPGAVEPSPNLPVRTIVYFETPDKLAVGRFLGSLPLDANKAKIQRFFELLEDRQTAAEVASSYTGCCMFGRRGSSAILVEKESMGTAARLLVYSQREHAREDMIELKELARKAARAQSAKYILHANPLKLTFLPYVGGIELQREPFVRAIRMNLGLLSTLIAPLVGLLTVGLETGWDLGAGSLQAASAAILVYSMVTIGLLLLIPAIQYERGRYLLEL